MRHGILMSLGHTMTPMTVSRWLNDFVEHELLIRPFKRHERSFEAKYYQLATVAALEPMRIHTAGYMPCSPSIRSNKPAHIDSPRRSLIVS